MSRRLSSVESAGLGLGFFAFESPGYGVDVSSMETDGGRGLVSEDCER